MSTSRKYPHNKPAQIGHEPDYQEALKLIKHWLETDESSDDKDDWEDLKAQLNKNRMPGRKLFPDA